VAGAPLGSGRGSGDATNATPGTGSLLMGQADAVTAPAHRVPAEWEPHDGTIVCWPARDELWGSLRDRAVEDHAALVAAVARFEPVIVVADPRQAEEAERMCARPASPETLCPPGGSTHDRSPRTTPHPVSVRELPIDDSWARDTGPLGALRPDGSRIVVGVSFNGWGSRYEPHEDDAALGRRWAQQAGEPYVTVDGIDVDGRPVPFVFEGGSVTVDGLGTVVTTEQCLRHPNRNPSMSTEALESALHRTLGTTTAVWLPHGLALDRDTDGHVDNVAAFIAPGLVLAQGCDDPCEADHDRLADDLAVLTAAHDATGERIRAIEVPVLPFAEVGGRRVAVPYLNLYLCNGGAVVPLSGHPADDDMLALIGSHLPGRTVVGVPGAVLAFGGGGPHCTTQQIPRRSQSTGADPEDLSCA